MSVSSRPGRAIVFLLVAAGCLLATISVPVIWLHQVVVNTDRYVATVAPLSDDPAIKDAVAAYISDELVRLTRIDELTENRFPDGVDLLSGTAADVLRDAIYEHVRDEMDSPEFGEIWLEANRRAHSAVTQVVLGRDGAGAAQEGEVALNLRQLLDRIRLRLISRGFFFLKDVSLNQEASAFTVLTLPKIATIQRAAAVLERAALWIPLLALACWGVAAAVCRKPRQTVLIAGLGTAAGMAFLLAGLALGRRAYLAALSQSDAVDVAAATSFFDIIINSFQAWAWGVLAGGLAAAAIAFLLKSLSHRG
ncbi:MAG: hypothetical protein IBX61_08465 [Thermoleophilia bacterium]|nr:hypothetical protein [Thermoleophilia bacterium]